MNIPRIEELVVDVDYRELWYALKYELIKNCEMNILVMMDELEVIANRPMYILHIDKER